MNVDSHELAKWLIARADGDPADALSAMCQVTAELMKLSTKPAVTRDKWVSFLDRYLATPATMFQEDRVQ